MAIDKDWCWLAHHGTVTCWETLVFFLLRSGQRSGQDFEIYCLVGLSEFPNIGIISLS